MWVTSPLYQQMSNQIQLEKMNKYEEYEFVFFWILKILKCVWMQCYLASWWFHEDLHTQAGQAKISHRISLRTYLYIMYLYIHIIYIYMLYINFPPPCPWESLAARLVAKLVGRRVAWLVAISWARKDVVARGFCLQRPVDLGAHPQTSAILDASGFNFSNSKNSLCPRLVFFS